MISALPVAVTVPVIVLESVVTAMRFRLINQTTTDKLINRSLIWGVVGMVLHHHDLAPRYASLWHQLSLGAILAILAGIYGIARLWHGADPTTTRQRQRRYDLTIALVFVAVLIAGTPARGEGMLIDRALGWPAVVFWAVFGAPLAVCAVSVLRICVHDFQVEDLGRREKLVYAAIFAAAAGLLCDALAGPTVAALQTYTDLPFPDDPRMSRKAATFFLSALLCSLFTAIPLLAMLATRLGWDTTSRHARRLYPLWRDLTAAFPGLVLYPAAELARHPPAARLHRMTVEIRDTLLGLRPYMRVDTTAGEGHPVADTELGTRISRYSVLVTHALDAKFAGAQPDPDTARIAPRTPSTANDPNSELRVLLALADRWPHVLAAASASRAHRPASTHQPTKERSR